MTVSDSTLRPGNKPWFLLQVKPNGLNRAVFNLERQLVATFTPRHNLKTPNGKSPKAAPLFPGYLFISFDSQDISFQTINSTFGVARFVSFGDAFPRALPEKLIAGLIERCDDAGLLKPIDDLRANERVRITSGPFVDFIAVVDSLKTQDRVRVLFELMGQPTKAEVSVRDLVRIPEASSGFLRIAI